jgi:hypothetical protein
MKLFGVTGLAISCRCGLVVGLALLLAGCGGGGDSVLPPSISIDVPTSAPGYSTTGTSVRPGGTIAHASFVHVLNSATGSTTEGYVSYYQGYGSWFADVYALVPGDNLITATADADGTGARTAVARITIARPLQPADLIINGTDQSAATTYWTDTSSFGGSHQIVIFGDGTGRSTTGSTVSEIAGTVSNFTWSKSGPDSIVISNCPNCSFQSISRISGSLGETVFYGQVVTAGGGGYTSVDVFDLASGKL